PATELPGAIERVYTKSQDRYSDRKHQLELWRFFWHDSIGNDAMADSLALCFDPQKLKGNDAVEQRIFFRLGAEQAGVNQFEKAIGFYHRGIKVSERHNNLKMLAGFKREIGKAYLKLGQNDPAIQYL